MKTCIKINNNGSAIIKKDGMEDKEISAFTGTCMVSAFKLQNMQEIVIHHQNGDTEYIFG